MINVINVALKSLKVNRIDSETTAKCIFICPSYRGQRLSQSFMPKTLAGQRDSSLPQRLWAGAQRSCCKYLSLSLYSLCDTCCDAKLVLFTVRDSADRVVGENGKYEELIACSHEIAASTAQLVAASKVKAELLPCKVTSCTCGPLVIGCSYHGCCDLTWLQVKADRSNKKLHTLQQASRHVNDMAAVVVTSTKHGQQQISDKGEWGSWQCAQVGTADFVTLVTCKHNTGCGAFNFLLNFNMLMLSRYTSNPIWTLHYPQCP